MKKIILTSLLLTPLTTTEASFTSILEASNSSSVEPFDRQKEELLELIASLSCKSSETWASLWNDNNSPVKLIDLNLADDSNLELLDLWLCSFHCNSYNLNQNSKKYIHILKDAQIKLENENDNKYSSEYLKFIISTI